MKIRTQFILLFLIIMVSLFLLNFITFASFYQLNTTTQINHEVRKIITEFEKITVITNALLYGYEINSDIEKFNNAYKIFVEKYYQFLKKPFVVKLTKYNQKLKQQYDVAYGLDDYCQKKMAEIYKQYDSLEHKTNYGFYIEFYYNKNNDYAEITTRTFEFVYFFRNASEGILYPIINGLEENNAQTNTVIRIIFIIISAIDFLALLFIVIFIFYTMNSQLNNQIKILTEISNGNFTEKLPIIRKNEIAKVSTFINKFIDSFTALIKDIKNVTQRNIEIKNDINIISQRSKDEILNLSSNISNLSKTVDVLDENIDESKNDIMTISQNVNDLSKDIDSHSDSIERTSSALTQITATIQNVSNVSKKKSDSISGLLTMINKGGQKVDETNEIIIDISSYITDILKINNMINELADQTNLLAMNAAIEASHAGEAGKGFSVVADEIRNLAESTDENAKKIKEILTRIIEKSQLAKDLSNESSAVFSTIKHEISDFTNALEEITLTMGELNKGSEEINISTANLTEIANSIHLKTNDINSKSNKINESITKIDKISDNVKNSIININEFLKSILSNLEQFTEGNDDSVKYILDLNDKINQIKIEKI